MCDVHVLVVTCLPCTNLLYVVILYLTVVHSISSVFKNKLTLKKPPSSTL